MSTPLVTRQRAQLEVLASNEATRGLLIALAGVAVVIGMSLDPRPWLPAPMTPRLWQAGLGVTAAVLAIAGWTFHRYPRFARSAAYAALVGFVIGFTPGLIGSPAKALLVCLGVAAVGVRVRWSRPLADATDKEVEVHPAIAGAGMESASYAAIGAWFLLVATELTYGRVATVATAYTFAVALAYSAAWMYQTWRETPKRERLVFLAFVPPLLAALSSVDSPVAALSWLTVHQLVAMLLIGLRRQTSTALWSGIVEHPARLLVTTFAAIFTAGGIALSLPVCAAREPGIEVLDAFFTSVSATCVTGLIVLDTPKDFTFFGQMVILALIQIGGLGIMTFSAGGVLLLGQRFGIRQESAARGLLADDGDENVDLYAAARRILVATFAIEALGALLLIGLFRWDGDTWGMAAWRGVFTSISAFCNAGFALQSDNMMTYQHHGAVLQVVSWLIILGGLGTPAMAVLPRFLRTRKMPLQAKLVFVTTAILLVVPTFLFLALEWNNTLAGMSLYDKLNNAWFASVVPRTAGFNSIDYGAIRPASITLTMLLMFIGGSPFSTAGGVKTTTIALLALAVGATVRGRSAVTAFGRTVSPESIYKAMAIMTMGSMFAVNGFIAIQLSQQLPFDRALFEVVSALGTVGLSMNLTPSLDPLGKLIIMASMFAGRVGPITLFLLLTERRREPKWILPEEKVAVG